MGQGTDLNRGKIIMVSELSIANENQIIRHIV